MTIGPLDADIPGRSRDRSQHLCPALQRPVRGEREVTGGVGVIEPGEPFSAELGFNDPDWQQIAVLDRAPRAIPIQATSRDEDMHVRMEAQRSPPGVQRAEQTDLGSEVLVIAQQLLQGLRRGLEQVIAAPFAVVLPQCIEHMRKGEDDMIMVAGKQARLRALQPVMGQGAMAARTTAMTTGVILLLGMTIIQTDPFFIAERFTLAQHDRLCGAALIRAQTMLLLIGLKPISEDALYCRFHRSHPQFNS